MRFDPGILDKAGSGLFRFRQIMISGRADSDPKGRKQRRHLFQLAAIMGRDQEMFAREPPHQRDASFCAATSVAIPCEAKPYISSNCARENAAPSALA